MIHVSRHAQNRYILRVNAICSRPDIVIRDMWRQGRQANTDDFSLWRVTPEADATYRIGKAPNGLWFFLIMRNETVITLLDQRYR